MVIAGETVLSEKTMLNPDRLITYAVYEKEFDGSLLIKKNWWIRRNKSGLNCGLMIQNSLHRMEWRIFASVALSFENSTDERIEEAVEEMLRKEWER